jgi:hypothetical protein
VLRILLIGCAGLSYCSFAGIFRTWQSQTKRFDTNLTPTHSLRIGLPIGGLLGNSKTVGEAFVAMLILLVVANEGLGTCYVGSFIGPGR